MATNIAQPILPARPVQSATPSVPQPTVQPASSSGIQPADHSSFSPATHGASARRNVLWLGDIPPYIREPDLERIFGPFLLRRIDLKHRGVKSFAFIHFTTIDGAARAKATLDGLELFPGNGPSVLQWRHDRGSTSSAGQPGASHSATEGSTARQGHLAVQPAHGPLKSQRPQEQPAQRNQAAVTQPVSQAVDSEEGADNTGQNEYTGVVDLAAGTASSSPAVEKEDDSGSEEMDIDNSSHEDDDNGSPRARTAAGAPTVTEDSRAGGKKKKTADMGVKADPSVPHAVSGGPVLSSNVGATTSASAADSTDLTSPLEPLASAGPGQAGHMASTSNNPLDITASVQHSQHSPSAHLHQDKNSTGRSAPQTVTSHTSSNTPPPSGLTLPPRNTTPRGDPNPGQMEGIASSGTAQGSSQQQESVAPAEPKLNLGRKKARKRAAAAQRAQKGQPSSSTSNQGSRDQSVEANPASPDNSHFNTPTTQQPLGDAPLNQNTDTFRTAQTDLSQPQASQTQRSGHNNATPGTANASSTTTDVSGSQARIDEPLPSLASLPRLVVVPEAERIDPSDGAGYIDPRFANDATFPNISRPCDCPEGEPHFCRSGRYEWSDFVAELEREAEAVSNHPRFSSSLSHTTFWKGDTNLTVGFSS